jgi:hypothetical protein
MIYSSRREYYRNNVVLCWENGDVDIYEHATPRGETWLYMNEDSGDGGGGDDHDDHNSESSACAPCGHGHRGRRPLRGLPRTLGACD